MPVVRSYRSSEHLFLKVLPKTSSRKAQGIEPPRSSSEAGRLHLLRHRHDEAVQPSPVLLLLFHQQQDATLLLHLLPHKLLLVTLQTVLVTLESLLVVLQLLVLVLQLLGVNLVLHRHLLDLLLLLPDVPLLPLDIVLLLVQLLAHPLDLVAGTATGVTRITKVGGSDLAGVAEAVGDTGLPDVAGEVDA
ncbi:hypothetical protein IWX46DRAFT_168637 [Phyllosticta citricarpa]|uniref:Uncharacterized protein n=1 Tax=Phyllosticta citricarpa TaxID=55181 RepID=A0ABR1M2D2_9PEZI